MGNIKTSYVKRIGRTLYVNYPERFTLDFSENKGIVKELMTMKSKKLINAITGYVTNLKAQEN